MLFTLGLLLLLTPFPSFQSPTNERRNSTGSDATKPNPVFTLLKPKTTAALAKQTVRPTLKPNTVNQTVLSTPAVKASTVSEVKATKDKPALTVVQNVQSTSPKSAPNSGAKTKNKPTASVNQTVVAKSPSTKDKAAPTVVQTALSTPAKAASAGGSAADKDKVTSSPNQSAVIKAPTATTTKEKPALAQPIKVVISDGCDSSNANEQELKLKPGAPLVMTHKISLLPGGCTGGCEAEMSALKGRVARLEREMSSIKEKCMYSVIFTRLLYI